MTTLTVRTTGQKVRILKESKFLVTVQSVDPVGYDPKGEPTYDVYNLSKKHHKGDLMLGNVSVI